MKQPLPLALQKRGAWLLHQQCWCWGHDVRRAEGNLLLQQGFTRVRPPQGTAGCTQYTLRHDDGMLLKLWGFGFFLGDRHGVYLNRYAFLTAPSRLTVMCGRQARSRQRDALPIPHYCCVRSHGLPRPSELSTASQEVRTALNASQR